MASSDDLPEKFAYRHFESRLVSGGIAYELAQTHADALKVVLERTATTKDDLARERSDSERDINALTRDIDRRLDLMERKLESLEQRMIIKFGALAAGAIAIVSVLVKLL